MSEEKKYKKFEDYDMNKLVEAYMRHVAFNTKCKETGNKIPFAFSEGKDGRVYYNDVSYEARMGKGSQGSTPSGDMDIPVPAKPSQADLDAMLEF